MTDPLSRLPTYLHRGPTQHTPLPCQLAYPPTVPYVLNNPSFWGTRPGGQAARLLFKSESLRAAAAAQAMGPQIGSCFGTLADARSKSCKGIPQVALTPGTRLGRFENASQGFCTSSQPARPPARQPSTRWSGEGEGRAKIKTDPSVCCSKQHTYGRRAVPPHVCMYYVGPAGQLQIKTGHLFQPTSPTRLLVM